MMYFVDSVEGTCSSGSQHTMGISPWKLQISGLIPFVHFCLAVVHDSGSVHVHFVPPSSLHTSPEIHTHL